VVFVIWIGAPVYLAIRPLSIIVEADVEGTEAFTPPVGGDNEDLLAI
jgi:hypothetical protein